ncbi:MAG: hypothetical protein AB8B51_09275 [Sedimentitalea sp.]
MADEQTTTLIMLDPDNRRADMRFLNRKAWGVRWSDRKTSRNLAAQALGQALRRPRPDPQGAGLALRTLAWQNKWIGAFESCAALSQRALSRLDPQETPDAVADVCAIMGVVHYSSGRRDLAADMIDKGLAHIDGMEATATRIDLLVTKSTIMRHNGRFTAAYDLLKQARELAHGQELARVEHNVARCLDQDHHPAEASTHAMQALIGARRHNNRVVLPYALGVLGSALSQMGQVKTALTYLAEGLSIADIDQDDRVKCQLLEQLGLISALAGHNDSALEHFTHGLEIAKDLNYPVWQKKFLRETIKIFEARGATYDALNAYRALVALLEAERA